MHLVAIRREDGTYIGYCEGGSTQRLGIGPEKWVYQIQIKSQPGGNFHGGPHHIIVVDTFDELLLEARERVLLASQDWDRSLTAVAILLKPEGFWVVNDKEGALENKSLYTEHVE